MRVPSEAWTITVWPATPHSESSALVVNGTDPTFKPVGGWLALGSQRCHQVRAERGSLGACAFVRGLSRLRGGRGEDRTPSGVV